MRTFGSYLNACSYRFCLVWTYIPSRSVAGSTWDPHAICYAMNGWSWRPIPLRPKPSSRKRAQSRQPLPSQDGHRSTSRLRRLLQCLLRDPRTAEVGIEKIPDSTHTPEDARFSSCTLFPLVWIAWTRLATSCLLSLTLAIYYHLSMAIHGIPPFLERGSFRILIAVVGVATRPLKGPWRSPWDTADCWVDLYRLSPLNG